MAAAAASVPALVVATPRSRWRDAGLSVVNMWAYLAAYELPNSEPEALAARAHLDYPIAIDRILGLGETPTLRLQHRFAQAGRIRRYERVLVWTHWVWFMVPHASVAYVWVRRRDRYPAAAARMYGVFDLGAVFYWSVPTAPPWYAARHGRLQRNGPDGRQVRRMMIEYGEQFWGSRWPGLYDVLGGNPLAAMPSLHFATSLMSAHLLSEVGPVVGAVGWTYAATLGVALVYLGEHYAADLLGGALLAELVRLRGPALGPLAERIGTRLESLPRLAGAG